jgi:predicted DNA-binding transcriptional regulator AlpA
MQHDNSVKSRRRWRRKALAEFWGVSDRTIDRMRRDGRLGPPRYIGRLPLWDDEQREAAERAEPFLVAQSA